MSVMPLSWQLFDTSLSQEVCITPSDKVLEAINALPRALYTKDGAKIIGTREVILVTRLLDSGSFRAGPNGEIAFTRNGNRDGNSIIDTQKPLIFPENGRDLNVFVDNNGKYHIKSDLHINNRAKFIVADDCKYNHSFDDFNIFNVIRFVYDLESDEISSLQVSLSSVESGYQTDFKRPFAPATPKQFAQFKNDFDSMHADNLVKAANLFQVSSTAPHWSRPTPAVAMAKKAAPGL